MAKAPNIFISYCRKDKVWLDRLQEQFAPLARNARLDPWDDSRIKPGTIWRDEIAKAIAEADVAVLLVTPAFLASDFIANNELAPLLAKKHVFWIAVSSSLYEQTVIEKYDCANDPKKPLASLSKAARNKALVQICAKILAAVQAPLAAPPLTGGTSPGGLFQVPYARNRYFTGREGVLDALESALATGRPTALTQAIAGLGGVGKTQTAVEFAYRHRNDYRYVLWARADSETSLNSEFLKLAEQLNLPEKDAHESARAIAAVQRWLSTTEGYLLVLDSADEPELLGSFLPVDPKGHILITTRAHHLDQCDPIALEVMEPNEALDFLLRRANRKDPDPAERAAAERLAKEELGYLPLALEQAASHIAVSEVSFQDYLKEYEKLRLKLLADTHHRPRDYPASVLTTWTTSFEAVRQRSAAAADLLIASAFLAPDSIPYEILLKGASELGETLAAELDSADGSEKPLYDLLTELRHYSLIRRHRESRTYDVQRLLQAVIRDGLDDTAQRLWAERVVRAVNKATPSIEFADWPACARLVPHWSSCADAIGRYQMVSREATRLLNQAGGYLWQRARYQEAEPLYRRALAIHESALGADHPQTAASLNNLALLYRDQGRYAEAEPLFRRALGICESALGADHPDTATSLNNLAELLQAQGRYAEAEPLLRRALSIREKVLGPDHPDTAQSLNNLAGQLWAQGGYDEAGPLLRQALLIREKVLGPDHPDTAASLNNLAGLLRAQGRYAEAEPLLRRALAITEAALGADHPHTARSLNNLAHLYRAQGREVEAEPLYRRALAIYTKALGPDHPDTAASRIHITGIVRTRDKQAKVVNFFQRAGCEIDNASLDGLTIRKSPHPLADYTPILVRMCLDGAPERSSVSGLASDAKRDDKNSVAFLVYDDPPKASARAEFPAAWSECRVSILPLELHAIENQLAHGVDQCWGLLDATLKTYGPGVDLFANTGQITDSLAFFGRQGLLDRIRTDLLQGQAVGLFGLRKTGKTSVLNHLAASLDKFIVIKLDLEGRGPIRYGTPIFNDILSQVGRLLRARGVGSEGTTPIDETSPAAETAPVFRERIRAIAARLRSADSPLPLMLFLDELERLLPHREDPLEKVNEFNALFGVLRAINQEERCLSLLIADLHAESNRTNYWSQPGAATNPVFSFFKEVYLAPFELVETRDMLNGIGQLMGYRFDLPLIEAIHAKSGGYPLLSRQIASVLIRERQGLRQLALDDHNQEILKNLFDASTFLHTYCEQSIWEDMRYKGPRAAADALRVLASNDRSVPTPLLRERLVADYSEAEVRKAIAALRDYGLIAEDEGSNQAGYYILPNLFARWLQMSMTRVEKEKWTL